MSDPATVWWSRHPQFLLFPYPPSSNKLAIVFAGKSDVGRVGWGESLLRAGHSCDTQQPGREDNRASRSGEFKWDEGLFYFFWH